MDLLEWVDVVQAHLKWAAQVLVLGKRGLLVAHELFLWFHSWILACLGFVFYYAWVDVLDLAVLYIVLEHAVYLIKFKILALQSLVWWIIIDEMRHITLIRQIFKSFLISINSQIKMSWLLIIMNILWCCPAWKNFVHLLLRQRCVISRSLSSHALNKILFSHLLVLFIWFLTLALYTFAV